MAGDVSSMGDETPVIESRALDPPPVRVQSVWVECPTCAGPVRRGTGRCPHCGARARRPQWSHRSIIGAGLLVTIAVALWRWLSNRDQ